MVIDMTVSVMEQNLAKNDKKKYPGDRVSIILDWENIDARDNQYMVITDCHFNDTGVKLESGDGITTTSNNGGQVILDVPVTFNSKNQIKWSYGSHFCF